MKTNRIKVLTKNERIKNKSRIKIEIPSCISKCSRTIKEIMELWDFQIFWTNPGNACDANLRNM